MNKEQEAAAYSNAKRVAVVAGPGSGKTTTLVQAVARRCRESGPQSVMCITFTVAGAREMEKRLAELPPEQGGPIRGLGFCGTLHSFLLRLARRMHSSLGLPSGVGVVDEEVAAELLGEVALEMGSKAAKKRLEELAVRADLARHGVLGTRPIAISREELAVVEFHRRLAREGLLTIDALLAIGHHLVQQCAKERMAIGEAGWRPWRHLFWDEFQDSGDLDLTILEAMPVQTKFIVGDPDQSIFGFRGARPGNFVRIVDEPGVPAQSARWEKHCLETNYRSGAEICRAAQLLVQRNKDRVQKDTLPRPGVDFGKVRVHAAEVPAVEAAKVVEIVNDFIHFRCEDAGPDAEVEYRNCLKEAAVLARTNKHARELACALKAAGLPVHEAVREEEPADWRTAKLIVAALAAPGSSIAWLSLARALGGKAEAEKAKVNATMSMCSVREALAKTGAHRWASPSLLSLQSELGFEAADRLGRCVAAVTDSDGRLDYGDLMAAMSAGEQQDKEQRGIYVGTAHSAKGREWDFVVVCGLEEGTFPSAKAKTDEEVEEERRLCFVAMTRARHELHLTLCKGRPQSRGPNLPPGPLVPLQPSRFIKEAGL